MRHLLRDSAAQELKSLTSLITDINCLTIFLKGQGKKHKMYFRQFDFKHIAFIQSQIKNSKLPSIQNGYRDVLILTHRSRIKETHSNLIYTVDFRLILILFRVAHKEE